MLVLFTCEADGESIAINPQHVEFVVAFKSERVPSATLLVLASGERWAVLGPLVAVVQRLNKELSDE